MNKKGKYFIDVKKKERIEKANETAYKNCELSYQS